jgi:hypothetical protein
MKTLLTLSACALLSSCVVDPNGNIIIPSAPQQPGYSGPPPISADPANTRVRYQDNHGRYTITLFPGGRYRFVSISQNETMADTTEGRWSYQRTGPQQGELRIGSEVWYLRFTSPDAAEGTSPPDMRTYYLSFERL